MLLALDSATTQAGVALFDGERVRALALWHGGTRHSPWLAPAVKQALTHAGATMGDLRAVAVAIGPGSFTALRVGLSLAKGIAAAQGLPLIGLSTLDATAFPHLEAGRAVAALVPAGRGRHAWALYAPTITRAAPWGPAPTLGTVEEIGEALASSDGPLALIGDLGAAERDALAARLGERLTLVPPALSLRSPAALAALGWLRLDAGDTDDAATLEPLYLQPPTSGAGHG